MFKRFSKFKQRHQAVFAFFIATGLITFWRGIEELLGIYVFPSDPKLSAWASVITGGLILYLTHAIIRQFSD